MAHEPYLNDDNAQETDGRHVFVVRGFASTADVMEAAQVCRAAGVACRLMPRPAVLAGAGCGTALRTELADERRVASLLAAAHLVVATRAEVGDRV